MEIPPYMKLAQRMSRLGTETAFEVLVNAQQLEAKGRHIIHLEIGEPDFEPPTNIVDAGKQALSDGFTSYTPSPGYDDLKESIAKDISKSRSINVKKENVIVTPGGKPIMFFIIMAMIENGDEVLYPNPGFPIYESMIKFCGGTAVPVRLGEENSFNLDIKEVETQISEKTKLMIVNSPNNPCGSVIEKKDLEALS